MGLPRVIWTYWAQGWDNAPPVAQISRRAWAACNPNWTLTPLDNASLDRFLPADLCQWVRQSPASWAAKSDRLRLELLRRYGGVWVDATTLPNQPLDLWLPEVLGAGFFAFWQPGAGRPIASWFLVSEPQGEVISEWSRRCDAYWSDRAQADNYFWVHTLFGDMLSENGDISAICARMPKIGAANNLHFGPDSDRLSVQPTQQDIADLIVPPVPVTKLSHKQQDTGGQGALFHRLLARANRYPAIYRTAPDQQTRKRILLTWYGSEAGHGTLGDQRSAEAAATALVAAGHDVVVSSSVALDIPGVPLQDWARLAHRVPRCD
ncbi:MAG: capsular polysaccharide synthesis protein [Thalassovita sp.]